jgi:hypothetical protein
MATVSGKRFGERVEAFSTPSANKKRCSRSHCGQQTRTIVSLDASADFSSIRTLLSAYERVVGQRKLNVGIDDPPEIELPQALGAEPIMEEGRLI